MNELKVSHLRCEYLDKPLGIDERLPRLSWQLHATRRGASQKSYRICVASSIEKLAANRAELWDTGHVASHRTCHIAYEGIPLNSRDRCYWLVEVCDERGSITRSEPSVWTMGLLSTTDWSASWIAADPSIMRRDPGAITGTLEDPGTAALFRREFSIANPVKRAMVYLSARGLIELRLNGQRVGNDLFAPEWTDYHTRIHYRSYDVTDLIINKDNCIAAILGDGWWSGFVGWQEQRGRYGSLENSLLVQLEIEYEDGSHTRIHSDENWRCDSSPIISSDFMMGEVYDARREQAGWDTATFVDSGFSRKACDNTHFDSSELAQASTSRNVWLRAKRVSPPTAKLVAQRSEPVRITEHLVAVSLTENVPRVFIYDFGQNISGWVRLSLPQLPKGTAITLRHGERLNEDGSLHTSNLRRAKSTDTYICRGDAGESWHPHFTFHGFQYLELSAAGAPEFSPNIDSVCACVIHSDAAVTGYFECSHPGVNRLWLNGLWSQRDNFISVPTDCPQRDERLGWTGDAQVFLRTATCNMDVAAFFTKWMMDIEDAQTTEGIFPDTAPRLREDINFVGLENLGGSAGWADAGVIIPYTLWRLYGDRRILQRHYAAMRRWLEWLDHSNPGGLRVNALANNYGDWLCIPSDTSFGTQSPMKTLLATAFWADDCAKLSRIAAELDHHADARHFAHMFTKVRDAFQKEWLLADGSLSVATQTAYLLALAFDLIPEKLRAQSTEHLVSNIRELDWHLSTGFIGVGLLNPQLTLNGRVDVAYRLLLQESYPAWLYPVIHGATTIWERWNGWTKQGGFFDPHMNSFNHYSLGSVGEWLFRHVGGIELDTAEAGSQHFMLCPYISDIYGSSDEADGLDYALVRLRSMHGEIESHWQKKPGKWLWNIRIPTNTTADIGIPQNNPSKIQLDGQALLTHPLAQNFKIKNERCWLTLAGGEYHFVTAN